MDPRETTLDLADRIAVAACRAWVRGYAPWRASVRAVAHHFEADQGRIFAFHLGALLAVLASAGHERMVMGPTESPRLWPGEAVLLDAIALSRRGCASSVGALMARFLDPAARRLAVYHLHGVAAALGTLPDADTPETAPADASLGATVVPLPAIRA